MKYFALQKKVDVGNPAYISGLMHDRVLKNGWSTAPRYSWYMVNPGEKLAKLPETVYFHTRDRLYLFDIRTGPMPGELLVSESMWEALRSYLKEDFDISNIELVSKHEAITGSKKYKFVRLGRSYFLDDAVLDGCVIDAERRKSGEIKKVHGVSFGEMKLPDVFLINRPSLEFIVFVSEDVRLKCSKLGVIGLEFVDSASVGKVVKI